MEKLPPVVIVAPEQIGEVLFEILPKLSEKIRLELAPVFNSQQLILHQPEIRLNFNYEQNQNRLSCQPEIKLLDKVYHGEDCRRLLTDESTYERSSIDPKQWWTVNRQPLKELFHFLERNRFEFCTDNWFIQEQGPLLKFMLGGLRQLPEEWPVTTNSSFEEFKIAPVKLESYVKVDIAENIDWFDFEIYYNLGGETYTHQEIMAMLRRTVDGSYIQVGNQWFLIDELSKIDLLEHSFARNTEKTGPARRPMLQLNLPAAATTGTWNYIEGNTVYQQFAADTSNENPIEACPLPDQLQGELRPYQKDGFYWLRFLHKYRFGGILADDMGLGKTLQVLTLIKSLPKQQTLSGSLPPEPDL